MNEFSILKTKEKLEDAFFNIDEYYFYKTQKEKIYQVIEHTIEIGLGNKKYSYTDVISILRDIDQSPAYSNVNLNKQDDEQDVFIKWLTNFPKEEYKYIKDFESKIHSSEAILFHDFMKEYIEICEFQDEKIECSIVFLGYTLINNIFEIKIKAFDYKILNNISKKIIEQFTKYNFNIKSENLNWLRLKELIVSENENFTCLDSDKLLKNTLKKPMEGLFRYVFKSIDKYGYIDIKIDEQKDSADEIKLKQALDKKKQLYGLLKPYLKLIMGSQFIYLHDEPSIDFRDEKNNRVLSFAPRLMQYYQKQWFEDYFGEILSQIKAEYKHFEIKSMMRNKIFNFYLDRNNSNNIEIDWIIDVEKEGIKRIIGIECKKTLKKTYNEETKNKIYNKVVKSGKAILDGYIIAGYFKESGFVGDIEIGQEYKPKNLFNEDEYSEEDVFIQYSAICDSSIKNMKSKIIECIETIYRNS